MLDNIGISTMLKWLCVKNQEVAILTFHRVSDEADRFWPPMAINDFRLLMDFLAHETVVVPLQEISSVESYPRKPLVCLSFDDGYMDFYENALPILKSYQLPCHHNVCPGLIDGNELPWPQLVNEYLRQNFGEWLAFPDGTSVFIARNYAEKEYLSVLNKLYRLADQEREEFVQGLKIKLAGKTTSRLMGWNEIRACSDAGVHIGSHGLHHNNLEMIDDGEILTNEIAGSRSRIAEQVGTSPEIFAFPSGKYNERCLEEVEKAGYKVALLCEDRAVSFKELKQSNHSICTRINIGAGGYYEEKERALGFHRKIKSLFAGKSHIYG